MPSADKPIFSLSYFRMRDVPEHWKPRLRALSYGPSEGTTHRWTYHQGDCFTAIMRYGDRIIAWASITFEEDEYPIVGCFVDPTQRKKGLGTACAKHMLEVLDMPSGTLVYAFKRLWPAWPKILESAKLVYVDWED